MKRFTETTKWRDPWFRRLSPNAKLLWLYLTDHCDCTGLIDLDFEAARFDIGTNVTEKHLAELVDRVQRTVEGKIFITRFIPFHYGVLSEGCPAHKPVLKLVKERNLSMNGKGYQYPTDREEIGLLNPTKEEVLKEKEEIQEEKSRPENQKHVEDFCISIGLPRSDGEAMWLHWKEKGMARVKDWKLTIRKWKSFRYLPSQKGGGVRPHSDQIKSKALEVEIAERFKGWIAEKYPERREAAMKWRVWREVPEYLRREWWKQEQESLIPSEAN